MASRSFDFVRVRTSLRMTMRFVLRHSSFVIVVGLWGGPYLTHIYGYGLEQRGNLLVIPVVTQVVGSVRSLDLARLVDALLERASVLTEDIVEELSRLRDFLRDRNHLLHNLFRDADDFS